MWKILYYTLLIQSHVMIVSKYNKDSPKIPISGYLRSERREWVGERPPEDLTCRCTIRLFF